MSAFMVSANHIAVMVDAKLVLQSEHNSIENENRDRLLKMLATENAASVNYRYFASKVRGGIPENPPEDFPAFDLHVVTRVGVVAILKAIDCYEYQSCEHSGWEDSDAKRFCALLRDALINKLPGYDAAPWGIE